VKKYVRTSFLGQPLSHLFRWFRQRRELILWAARGRPAPPPHIVKQRVVRSYGWRFSLRTLIETGTFTGDMVDGYKRSLRRLIYVRIDNEPPHEYHEEKTGRLGGLL
jgi:hypothetical protein